MKGNQKLEQKTLLSFISRRHSSVGINQRNELMNILMSHFVITMKFDTAMADCSRRFTAVKERRGVSTKRDKK